MHKLNGCFLFVQLEVLLVELDDARCTKPPYSPNPKIRTQLRHCLEALKAQRKKAKKMVKVFAGHSGAAPGDC